MSRVKQETKIKRLIESLNYSERIQKAMNILIKYNKDGVVYVKDLKHEDSLTVAAAASEIVTEKLITYYRDTGTLYINAFNQVHYYNLTLKPKRRYIKTKMSSLLDNNILCGHIFAEQENDSETLYTSVAKGFKVPQIFKNYLTSEPLKDDIVKDLLKAEPERLQLELARRNLTKEQKILFCFLMYYSEKGEIVGFNTHKLLTTIRNMYKDRSYCYATLDNALKRLIELQLINIYQDKHKIKHLVVLGYNDAFKSKGRYVIIPDVVFKKRFKALEAGGVKVFFWLSFLLNNGEDDADHYLGQKKATYMKFLKESFDSKNSKEKYDNQMLWLKKRHPKELANLLFGISKKETSALAEFFHFTKPNKKDEKEDRVLQVRVRKEYFISKKSELFKPLLDLKEKDRERFNAIQNAVKSIDINCKDKDVVTVIKLLRNESIQFIGSILEKFATYAANNKVLNPIGLLIKMYRELTPTVT